MLCIKSAQQWSSFVLVLEEERGATFYSILHVIVRCVFIYYRPASQFKGTFLRNVQEVWALIAKQEPRRSGAFENYSGGRNNQLDRDRVVYNNLKSGHFN